MKVLALLAAILLYWRSKLYSQLKLEVIKMQLCPVSYAVGCAKCPVFKVCPGKNIIGDAAPQSKDKEKKKEPSK